jgi:hypothetical protein
MVKFHYLTGQDPHAEQVGTRGGSKRHSRTRLRRRPWADVVICNVGGTGFATSDPCVVNRRLA